MHPTYTVPSDYLGHSWMERPVATPPSTSSKSAAAEPPGPAIPAERRPGISEAPSRRFSAVAEKPAEEHRVEERGTEEILALDGHRFAHGIDYRPVGRGREGPKDRASPETPGRA